MDYRDRHVIVTGGTGALGGAVVGALMEAGAICHVPYVVAAEAERFRWRDHPKVANRLHNLAQLLKATNRSGRDCRNIWYWVQALAITRIAVGTRHRLLWNIGMGW